MSAVVTAGLEPAAARLHVDYTACVAHGLCADWLPEAISLDEWGYPVLTGAVSRERFADAELAAAECPVRALLLLRDDATGRRTPPRAVHRHARARTGW